MSTNDQRSELQVRIARLQTELSVARGELSSLPDDQPQAVQGITGTFKRLWERARAWVACKWEQGKTWAVLTWVRYQPKFAAAYQKVRAVAKKIYDAGEVVVAFGVRAVSATADFVFDKVLKVVDVATIVTGRVGLYGTLLVARIVVNGMGLYLTARDAVREEVARLPVPEQTAPVPVAAAA